MFVLPSVVLAVLVVVVSVSYPRTTTDKGKVESIGLSVKNVKVKTVNRNEILIPRNTENERGITTNFILKR